MAMSEIRTFQIFREGSFTSMAGETFTYTAADLQDIASSYSEAAAPAPLVLGHPESNGPPYGTVKRLSVSGGALFATAQVDRTLVDLVQAGRYGKVSAAFYPPSRGRGWYLRHVGFLGAMPPAVKGMARLDFAEGNPLFIAFSESPEQNPLLADAAKRKEAFDRARGLSPASSATFSEPRYSSNPLIADAERKAAEAQRIARLWGR